jgi:hypothetical protein
MHSENTGDASMSSNLGEAFSLQFRLCIWTLRGKHMHEHAAHGLEPTWKGSIKGRQRRKARLEA